MSLRKMKIQKEKIREMTMKRIESMGMKPPSAWKDEIYQNELKKLDIKKEMTKKLEKSGANTFENKAKIQ